jgi:cob(I)alamin adenosyltransferase
MGCDMDNRLTKGLVQIYTGTGKGKTTAALGLAFRAIGHDFHVCFIQFLKGSSYCGELFTSQRLKPYIDFYQFGIGCPHSALIRSGHMKCTKCGYCFKEKTREQALIGYKFSQDILAEGKYDLVVLDEINNALRLGLLTMEEVLALVKNKPEHMELVLTGRGLPPELLDVADLVSEITAVKHPFENGIESRRGIEY